MTIGQAISQVKSDNRIFNDDSMLTDRFIWHKIKTFSQLFIKQKNDKFDLNTNFIYSTLTCIDMIMVDSTECCPGLPACKILRSAEKIPRIVDSNSSSVMRGIYTVDSGIRIDLVTIDDIIRMNSSKYKSKGIKAFFKDDYLFIPWRENPKAVTIDAHWENPEEVFFMNECKKKDFCMSVQDMEWRVPSDIQSAVLQEVNKEIANFYSRIRPDENTNKNEAII